jgi:hypothetical protein
MANIFGKYCDPYFSEDTEVKHSTPSHEVSMEHGAFQTSPAFWGRAIFAACILCFQAGMRGGVQGEREGDGKQRNPASWEATNSTGDQVIEKGKGNRRHRCSSTVTSLPDSFVAELTPSARGAGGGRALGGEWVGIPGVVPWKKSLEKLTLPLPWPSSPRLHGPLL